MGVAMEERGLQENDWEDRNYWRRDRKAGYALKPVIPIFNYILKKS